MMTHAFDRFGRILGAVIYTLLVAVVSSQWAMAVQRQRDWSDMSTAYERAFDACTTTSRCVIYNYLPDNDRPLLTPVTTSSNDGDWCSGNGFHEVADTDMVRGGLYKIVTLKHSAVFRTDASAIKLTTDKPADVVGVVMSPSQIILYNETPHDIRVSWQACGR